MISRLREREREREREGGGRRERGGQRTGRLGDEHRNGRTHTKYAVDYIMYTELSQ